MIPGEVLSPTAADNDDTASLDDLLKRMPEIATAVNAFSSETVQQRAFDALLSTIPIARSTATSTPEVAHTNGSNGHIKTRRRRSKVDASTDLGDVTERRRRKSGSPKTVGDLNLRPDGKASFRDFVAAKAPSGALEQNVVAAYYVKQELSLEPISIDHIHTCYLNAEWRLPANLQNSLSKSAMKGWLNTSDQDDIQLTAQGINLVRHDLPRKKA